MSLIQQPSNISSEAWTIMRAVYENYEKNDSTYFEDFSQFDFPHNDLVKYCLELQDDLYVILHNPDEEMYLYMLPNILGCFED